MKNKSIILGLFSAVFACNLVFTSCSEPEEVEQITILEKRVYTAEDSIIDSYPRMKGEAHGGNYFSRTDGANPYGMACLFEVNDTLLSKDLRVVVDFWGRVDKTHGGCSFAVALHDGSTMVSWTDIDLKKHIKEPNKWVHVVDSITIPGTLINKKGMVVKNFSFNHNAPQFPVIFDSDDLEISFKSVKKMLSE